MIGPLFNAITVLKQTIHDLEATEVKLTLPAQDLTLTEALHRVRAVAGDHYIRISFEVVQYGHTGPNTEKVKWEVYTQSLPGEHGKGEVFTAHSLVEAVNACLAAHGPKPEPAEQLKDIEATLEVAAGPTEDIPF